MKTKSLSLFSACMMLFIYVLPALSTDMQPKPIREIVSQGGAQVFLDNSYIMIEGIVHERVNHPTDMTIRSYIIRSDDGFTIQCFFMPPSPVPDINDAISIIGTLKYDMGIPSIIVSNWQYKKGMQYLYVILAAGCIMIIGVFSVIVIAIMNRTRRMENAMAIKMKQELERLKTTTSDQLGDLNNRIKVLPTENPDKTVRVFTNYFKIEGYETPLILFADKGKIVQDGIRYVFGRKARDTHYLPVNDPTVSRDQAILTVIGSKYYLKNIISPTQQNSNPTVYNGRPMEFEETVELHTGDTIVMGAKKLIFMS